MFERHRIITDNVSYALIGDFVMPLPSLYANRELWDGEDYPTESELETAAEKVKNQLSRRYKDPDQIKIDVIMGRRFKTADMKVQAARTLEVSAGSKKIALGLGWLGLWETLTTVPISLLSGD